MDHLDTAMPSRLVHLSFLSRNGNPDINSKLLQYCFLSFFLLQIVVLQSNDKSILFYVDVERVLTTLRYLYGLKIIVDTSIFLQFLLKYIMNLHFIRQTTKKRLSTSSIFSCISVFYLHVSI